MNQDTKIEEMIRSYRFTVTVLSLVIVGMFVVFAGVLLMFMPKIVHNEFVSVLVEWRATNQ